MTGLSFYDNEVLEFASHVKRSPRGELGITDLNVAYLQHHLLSVELLSRDVSWLHTNTPDEVLEAANFVRTLQLRQGRKIACLEEVAFRLGLIDADQLLAQAMLAEHAEYGRYLRELVDGVPRTL